MIRAAVATPLVTLLLAGCGAPALTGAGARGMTAAQALKLRSTISAVRFTKVSDDLYRSGLPSDADMAAFAGMGIKTDITLQSLSGNEGGVFTEPLADLSKVLASLVDSHTNILVPGFYANVRPNMLQAALARLESSKEFSLDG